MSGDSLDTCVEVLESQLNIVGGGSSFLDDVENFSSKTLLSREFDIKGFSQLMVGVDLCFDDLYRRYVGKNVLNFFRQDHGYKEGSYVKVWNGREDNEHLVDIVSALDAGQANFKDEVYASLKARYQQLG